MLYVAFSHVTFWQSPRKRTATVRTAALHTFGQISGLTAWLTGYAIFSQTSVLSLAPGETSGPLVNNPRTHEPPVTHWLGGWYSVCGSTLCDGHVVEAAQSQRCIWAAQQSQGVGRQRSGVWVLSRIRVALQKILGFGHCNLLVLDQRGHNNVRQTNTGNVESRDKYFALMVEKKGKE